ncbi:MAG: hypothetical protein Q4G03_12005 [Planctomycetia bacterium]|nr:hypothetical protein [Planctomycetia bacterium]
MSKQVCFPTRGSSLRAMRLPRRHRAPCRPRLRVAESGSILLALRAFAPAILILFLTASLGGLALHRYLPCDCYDCHVCPCAESLEHNVVPFDGVTLRASHADHAAISSFECPICHFFSACHAVAFCIALLILALSVHALCLTSTPFLCSRLRYRRLARAPPCSLSF